MLEIEKLEQTIESNHHQERHHTQLDRIYGDRDRKEKLYADIPVAMCACDVCVRMAKEVYGVDRVISFEMQQLKDLVKHCWLHEGYHNCGYEQMTTSHKILYKKVIDEK